MILDKKFHNDLKKKSKLCLLYRRMLFKMKQDNTNVTNCTILHTEAHSSPQYVYAYRMRILHLFLI